MSAGRALGKSWSTVRPVPSVVSRSRIMLPSVPKDAAPQWEKGGRESESLSRGEAANLLLEVVLDRGATGFVIARTVLAKTASVREARITG